MSKSLSLQHILALAKEKEKKYDWLGAVEFHKKALDHVLKYRDFFKAGEVQERIGFCFHRAAMQAGSREKFQERMRRAVKAYEKAHGFYKELTDEQRAARMFRCTALTKYLGYWLTSNPSEKRKLLDDCLELEGKALSVFLESENMLEYEKTYNELWLVFFCRSVLEWDRQTLKSIARRGLEWGEKAVVAISELNDLYETARSYLTLATCLYSLWVFIAEPERQEQHRLKVEKYLSKAVDLSEKVSDTFLLGWSRLWLGTYTGKEEALSQLKKALECGKRTRDNFLIAAGLDWLAYMTYWKAVATEDPDQRRKLAEEAMKFYDKAQHHYSIMSFLSARGGFLAPPAGYAEHYLYLAMWETDPKKRLELLEKSEKDGMEALKLAEDSCIWGVVAYVLHVVSKTLEARAHIEQNPTEKRSSLEKALKYREKTIEIYQQLYPFHYWALGAMQNYLAGIKVELADIELDTNSKRRLLEEAVLSKEKCLELCNKIMSYYERRGDIANFAVLQRYQDTYVTLLTRLYDLADKPENLRKAIEISRKAIESASKLDMVSLMAASYWKIAKTQDILGEHLKAAENFERASESYIKAAEKIPQLKDFYQDHALYMQAWNEIEKAKYYHVKKQYRLAKEHYEKAADLHNSTERWNYLSTNYLSWARLEEAEDLSRRGQTEEARDLFKQTAKLFVEAKKSIKAKLEKFKVIDEKEMATELVKASDVRHEYCLGRIALEDAKILDRHGDPEASSEKYGSAAEWFQKIAEVEPEQSQKELLPIIYLCEAWQKMMMAEAKASSSIYGEAAELFKQAKKYTFDQPTSLLALANSSFCKALEAGTNFEATRDMSKYSKAKKYMEAAANYYIKAGFKNGSYYAKATQRLFDAYIYMDKAETETEPRKKAQYYQMAEKLLQVSAGLYMKAKHPEKVGETRRLLESVKEERKLAMSLTEVLHAPTTASTTTSFSTPTPTHEKAVGLERFEHAAIEADLVLSSKEATVGENFNLEMHIVNVGKEEVLLAKVEEILPTGFEVVAKPDYCHLEDACLDMKGKRLDPVKTEEVRLVLRSFDKGTFEIKPRIFYVDETGHQLLFQLKPVTIKVAEVTLPDRIVTGYKDLDNLLFGGIPKNYAIILTSPSCDEREMLIERFLEAGTKEGQITFHVTIEASGVKTLAEEFQSNFFLFICNPRADTMIKSLPNVFKLKGVENLTDISIALNSAFRRLDASLSGPRRACIEIVSDVLLHHHAVHTRRWLTGLLPELRSKGFTTLAVLNPQMHPSEEVHAILGLFEGEINIYEKETERGLEKFLKIRKMYNQRYLETELRLRKEKLKT